MVIIFLLLLFLFSLIVPHQSHAIIFIPALILIPIAKILAVLIAGFSVPAIGVGAVWSHLTKRSIIKGMVYGVVALLCIAVIVGIVLRILHPDRPLF